jgi:hypothetical protein
MLRSVLLAFTVLAITVFVAVAAGVRFVSDYVRTHRYTLGEIETVEYAFGTGQLDEPSVDALAVEIEMAAGTLSVVSLGDDAAVGQVARVKVSDNVLEVVPVVDYTVAQGRGTLRVFPTSVNWTGCRMRGRCTLRPGYP